MENKDIETLLAKEAIRDQIYTYCRALDRIDNTWRQIHICTKQIPAGFNCYSGFMGSVF